MDLIALWNREKARVAAQVEACGATKSEVEHETMNVNKRSTVSSNIAANQPSHGPKKVSTTPSMRPHNANNHEFQLLLDSSLTPFSSVFPVHLFSQNAFAMEYAARATRSSSGSHQSSTSSARISSNLDSPSTCVRPKAVRTTSIVQQPPPPAPPIKIAQSNTMATLARIVTRKDDSKRRSDAYPSQQLKPLRRDVDDTRGDQFEGMLYMSRMQRSYNALVLRGNNSIGKVPDRPWMELAGRSVLRDGVSNALAAARGNSGGTGRRPIASRRSTATTSIAYSKDESEKGNTSNSVRCTQQQRCSLTLSNWSFNPENARLLVEEKGVEALIRLCTDGDKTTRLHCVTALMNLSHVGDLRSEIVQQGAVKTIVEMVTKMDDQTIQTACAISLCNLCSLQGQEEILVDHGAVSALSILSTEDERLAPICRCALFNLTCVTQSYHKIESVLKALIALALTRSGTGGFISRREVEYDEMTVKGLCNLSNLKRIRLRLVEEGVVSCLPSLLHPTVPLIQEVAARTLLNLSRLTTCRSEMVAKGGMGTLLALAKASSATTTKCVIGNVLWHLSKDPNNGLRMVLEGLLLLVNQLCTTDQPDLFLSCARTVYNVSCCEESGSKLVERQAVATLSYISQQARGEANLLCTLALCNLLSVRNAAADIVTAGAITALIQLSMAPDQTVETRDLFSKALHGLCDKGATRTAAIHAQVVPALLFLSRLEAVVVQNSVSTNKFSAIRARCVVAFACLAADPDTALHVCNAAVVQCVASILTLEHANVAVERFCCSCLSLLCRAEQCSLLMVEVGALERVLTTCVDSMDQDSKASCCHVLASVSSHARCCIALVRMGVLSVLATLATIKDNALIQRCCAITLANLSVEPTIRATLASAGVVAIVTAVSNSYSEENQRDCAKVLCNLSCIQGNESALVQAGAVNALMMICLVRAGSVRTKETCVRALVNLLNVDTIQCMVAEGLVQILATLAPLQLPLLVTILFRNLIQYPLGRTAICAEKTALPALFHLMTYTHVKDEAQHLVSLHVNLLSALVNYETLRRCSLDAGLLPALDRIAAYETHSLAVQEHTQFHSNETTLARVFLTLATKEDSRLALASSSSVQTVVACLSLHIDQKTVEGLHDALATLCWLAWHEETRHVVRLPTILKALTRMIQSQAKMEKPGEGYPLEVMTTCVLTLCCLAQSKEAVEWMATENIVTHFIGIVPIIGSSELETKVEILPLVSILFRQLSHVAGFATALAPSVALFCDLVAQIKATHDIHSALDCADALYNIVFASVAEQQARSIQSSETVATRSHGLVDGRVLAAIASLLSDEQLPETRWRCCATLWALSSVKEYRKELVNLGATRMLVAESYRATKMASLETLFCGAGALCNLTIVPHEANSAKMVEEGAIPALLQLAKLENKDIREFCTLALSNLSGPSPKVEAGAVSALLHMSLDFSSSLEMAVTSSAATKRASQPQVALLSRPPLISGERHKKIATLPNYALDLKSDNSVNFPKYEAEVEASTPPAPHVPKLTLFGTLKSRMSTPMDRKTVPSHSTLERDDGSEECMGTTFYEKVKPEESLAGLTEMKEQEKKEDEAASGLFERIGIQEQNPLLSSTERSFPERLTQNDILQAPEHAKTSVDAAGAPKMTLSPLTRVVAQKRYARKLSQAAARRVRQRGGAQHLAKIKSSPSLRKGPRDSALNEVAQRIAYSSLQTMTQGDHSLSLSTSLIPSASTASLPSRRKPNEALIDSPAALAGLNRATLLRDDDSKSSLLSVNAAQQKKQRAVRNGKKKEHELSSESSIKEQRAEPKVLSQATTIEEFQDQAKLLSLLS